MKIFLIWLALIIPATAQVKLLALGDSLTAGYGLLGAEAFPAQLEKILNGKASIINAGVSGDTSQSGLERLEWSLTPEVKGVILELGANDMLRAVSPAITRANLEKIILILQEKNIKIYLCGMLASPNLGESFATPFNAIYKDLAAKYNLDYDEFFLEGVAGNPTLLLKDGLHPTSEGVKHIATRLAPKIEKFIEKIK